MHDSLKLTIERQMGKYVYIYLNKAKQNQNLNRIFFFFFKENLGALLISFLLEYLNGVLTILFIETIKVMIEFFNSSIYIVINKISKRKNWVNTFDVTSSITKLIK